MISMTLPAVLIIIIMTTGFLSMNSTSIKSSAFECGFMMFSMSGMPFSMPFFIISLMFLLFDVEILLICFYPLVNSFTFFVSGYYWAILVTIGTATVYEWKKGVLKWI